MLTAILVLDQALRGMGIVDKLSSHNPAFFVILLTAASGWD